MSLLETIESPADVQALLPEDLPNLCEEIRHTIVETVAQNGGHLASNLGVVELTVALHRKFSFPQDTLVWDVGHQCYTHKLLTGRYSRFGTLRQTDGISGFPNPAESPCDSFIAGHSSTSISAACGIARAKAMAGDPGYTVAVIGDGALTGGLAFEGLFNAAQYGDRLIIILNDNRMSISRNVGYIARHLATLRSLPLYVQAKNGFGNAVAAVPLIGKPLHRLMVRWKCRLKGRLYHSSSLFEDMGFYYLGPVNGHNLRDLSRALQSAKDLNRPVLLHVETVKGQGYRYALQNPDRFHGVSGFDITTGQLSARSPSFSVAAGKCLCELAEQDPKLCVVTAAMTGGTGLSGFSKRFPERFFDVGIAEQHAVTFSSALAVGGCRPVFAVYSTFLQRAYDQLINDTAIMNNHIVLAVDRAGLVPDDGETHQGIYDVAFLSTIPHTTVFAPSTFSELEITLKQALYETEGIAVVRYPKGGEHPALKEFKPDYKPVSYFRNADARTVLVTYGRTVGYAMEAAERLSSVFPVSVIKLTQIYPIPEEALQLAGEYRRIVFAEEGTAAGGIADRFGAKLMELSYAGRYETQTVESSVPACSVADGLARNGLDTAGLIRRLYPEATVDE